MLEFVKANMYSLVAVLVFVIGLLFLYKKGKKEFVRQIVLSLVVQAEKALGSGTGELKYATVVEGIYKVLPPILTLLYTKKEIDNMIEEFVQYLKDYLKGDINLLGYEDEYTNIKI